MRRFSKLFGGFGIAAILVGLAIGVYAFTASNTVSPSSAGDGTGNITGFNVSNISWGLDANVVNKMTNVSFQLTPDNATNVTIEVGGNTYGGSKCSEANSVWTCDMTSKEPDAGTATTTFEVTSAH